MGRWLRLLAGVVLLLLVLAAGVGLASRWVLLPDLVRSWVFAPLERQTGIAVDAEIIRLGVGGLVLGNVVVREPAATAGSPPTRGATESPARPALLQVREITVRPRWRTLLDGRLAIGEISVREPRLDVRRAADGSSNLGRLLDAVEPDASPTVAVGPHDDPAARVSVESLDVRNGEIALVDASRGRGGPLRLSARLDRLSVDGLADGPAPIPFDLAGSVDLGAHERSTVTASGTIATDGPSIEGRAKVDRVDVDALVALVEATRSPSKATKAKNPLEGVRATARVDVGVIRVQGFSFTEARVDAKLADAKLLVSSARARTAGGTIDLTGTVDLAAPTVGYDATARIERVDLSKVEGWLVDVDWGRNPHPIASADVKLQSEGTSPERFLDRLSLSGSADVDRLDLLAIAMGRRGAARADGTTPAHESDALDPGGAKASLTLSAETLWVGPYELSGVQSSVQLVEGLLHVPRFDAGLAGGALSLTGDVDFRAREPSYSVTSTLTGARIEDLTRPIATPAWGSRTGIVGWNVRFRGTGVELPAALRRVEGGGQVSWTDGRIRDSAYLREISTITGIPGFRDLRVSDSGGRFEVHDGTVSTERFGLWGPEAAIQTSGHADVDGNVDAEVSLGIGPTSNRELFSTGIALPYVYGPNGWRFVPVRVTGTLRDPKMTIPPRAVLRSALTTVPGAGMGVVSSGLGATQSLVEGSADAVARGTEAVLPGVAGTTVGGAVRAGSGLFTRGGRAVGSLVDGVGGLFLRGADEILPDQNAASDESAPDAGEPPTDQPTADAQPR